MLQQSGCNLSLHRTTRLRPSCVTTQHCCFDLCTVYGSHGGGDNNLPADVNVSVHVHEHVYVEQQFFLFAFSKNV